MRTCYVTGSVREVIIVHEAGRTVPYAGGVGPFAAAGLIDRLLRDRPPGGRAWCLLSGLADVAPLVLTLRRAGADVRTASPSALVVALSLAGGAGVDRAFARLPDVLGALAPSAGGPAPAGRSLDETAALAVLSRSPWDRVEADRALADRVTRHPAWAYLSFFRGLVPAGVARLLAAIGDPRWVHLDAAITGSCPYDLLAWLCSGCRPGPDAAGVGWSGDEDAETWPSYVRRLRAAADLALVHRGAPPEAVGRPEGALLAAPTRPERLAALAGLVHRAWLAALAPDAYQAGQLLCPEVLLPAPGDREAYLDYCRRAGVPA